MNEVQKDIIEEFSVFDEWLDKYNYLIEMSREIPEIAQEHRTEKNLISGCQSRVWLHASFQNGKIHFTADSDAIITKGIIALLLKVLNDRSPAEIKDADMFFIDEIGLRQNLSPTRSNGLLAMIKQIKLYAIAWDAKTKTS
ncbi:MAG: SufE family protein [Bacteroidales bacterium]